MERLVPPRKVSILVATLIVGSERSADSPVVPIRLLNLSPDPITIHKDTKVAVASSEDEDSVLVGGVGNGSNQAETVVRQ